MQDTSVVEAAVKGFAVQLEGIIIAEAAGAGGIGDGVLLAEAVVGEGQRRGVVGVADLGEFGGSGVLGEVSRAGIFGEGG